ncbi:glycerol-3-phosphate acyltransferase [Cerasibacillus sp. JNUCC 74]
MNPLNDFILIVLSYLCGCINGAYYLGKLYYRQDIRELGSSNAGARNAGRVFGKSAFIFTVIIDVLKTIIPLLFAFYLFHSNGVVLGCMTFAILLGHVWPIQLHFRGGKGVVVYLAASLIVAPLALIISGVIILIAYPIIKKLTIVTMSSFTSMPIILLFFYKDVILAIIFFIMLFIIVILHRNGDQT